jgi:hypothetical protein
MLGALTNLSNYQAVYDLTNPDLLAIGDFNNDHLLNNADVQGMLTALTSGASPTALVPEPTSGLLAAIGGMVMIAVQLFRHLSRSARFNSLHLPAHSESRLP